MGAVALRAVALRSWSGPREPKLPSGAGAAALRSRGSPQEPGQPSGAGAALRSWDGGPQEPGRRCLLTVSRRLAAPPSRSSLAPAARFCPAARRAPLASRTSPRRAAHAGWRARPPPDTHTHTRTSRHACALNWTAASWTDLIYDPEFQLFRQYRMYIFSTPKHAQILLCF